MATKKLTICVRDTVAVDASSAASSASKYASGSSSRSTPPDYGEPTSSRLHATVVAARGARRKSGTSSWTGSAGWRKDVVA